MLNLMLRRFFRLIWKAKGSSRGSKSDRAQKETFKEEPSLSKEKKEERVSEQKAQLQKLKEEKKEERKEEKEKPKMKKKRASTKAGAIIKKITVRSELNLEQNSVFTVSTYRKKSREIVFREKTPSGEVIERKVIIGKTAKGIETGVLTTSHFKVYLCLVDLWQKAGRPIHEPVQFTISQIVESLGLAFSGKTYEEIKRLLLDLRQIPLTFINSFFDPKRGYYRLLKPFTILNRLEIYEREKKKEKEKEEKIRGQGEFRFDDHILTTLSSHYSHPLRLDVIREFKKHKDLAILLYTYLDRNLAFREEFEVSLEKLFEHLGLSQKYVRKPVDRKTKIEPVAKELEGKELSTGILALCKVRRKKGEKDYKLVAKKISFQRLKGREEVKALSIGKEAMMILLMREGLTKQQAKRLVEEHDWKKIMFQLELLPFRLKKYRKEGEKKVNKAAILYRSIEEDWEATEEYLREKEKAERKKRIKYYNIYRCTRFECDRWRNTIWVRREDPQPKKCPECGAPLFLEQKNAEWFE